MAAFTLVVIRLSSTYSPVLSCFEVPAQAPTSSAASNNAQKRLNMVMAGFLPVVSRHAMRNAHRRPRVSTHTAPLVHLAAPRAIGEETGQQAGRDGHADRRPRAGRSSSGSGTELAP